MSLLTRRVFCALGLGLVALPGACLSPTLPLPPPDEPKIESVGQGLVVLTGSVPEPNVPVIAVNGDTGIYAGQDADSAGDYRFPIAAEPGDRMRIWYLVGNERSQDRAFDVPRFGLDAMDEPVVSAPDADGLVTVTGVVPDPLAQVFVSSPSTNVTEDVASDEEGYFSVQIAAQSGDDLELWYKFGSDLSPVIVVEVP